MSSSGKGQSTVSTAADIDAAWQHAVSGARGAAVLSSLRALSTSTKITLLTVRHRGGTTFCAPIGHRQEGGDYQESWQPQQCQSPRWLPVNKLLNGDGVGGWVCLV